MADSLWDRIADLPLTVESLALDRLEASGGVERVTTLVRLGGRGAEGQGEEIGALVEDHDALAAAGPTLPLAGGGMGELGPARHQIQLLASLSHPDAPNDVAPSAYNLAELPDALPTRPLPAPAGVEGFR
jgi:hypothetical protein